MIKISYLCQFIDRQILNAIGYKRFNQEKDILAAVLEYVNDRFHPTMIKQLKDVEINDRRRTEDM